MVDCDKAIVLLNDYIDDLLEPSVRGEIDALLEKNARCNRIFADALVQRQILKQLIPVSASDGFDQQLRLRIQALASSEEKTIHVNKRGISYIFSGALLVVAIYFMMFTNIGTETQTRDIQPSSTISAPAATQMLPVTQKRTTASVKGQTTKDSLSRSVAKPINEKAIKLVGEGH